MAAQLFHQKDDRKFVGLRLWWLGFPVDDQYWLPAMENSARWLDRCFWLIPRIRRRFDRDEQAPTLQETLASRDISNVIISRIKRRLSKAEMEVFHRVSLDVATGDFTVFEPDHLDPSSDNKMIFADDKRILLSALGIEDSSYHNILGARLHLARAIQPTLKHLTLALRQGGFVDAVRSSKEGIFQARDDIRDAMHISWALHEGLKWIYGDNAFGLRRAAWVAKKCPDIAFPALALIYFRLCQIPEALYPSETIRKLRLQAEAIRSQSDTYLHLYKNDPFFREVLRPRRVREAFADIISLRKWHDEIDSILQVRRDQGTEDG